MIWQLLAAMFKARELGTGPSEFLAAGYRAERLKGTDAADGAELPAQRVGGRADAGALYAGKYRADGAGRSHRAARGERIGASR